jgi:DNA-binding GntR family transcriptional regulator
MPDDRRGAAYDDPSIQAADSPEAGPTVGVVDRLGGDSQSPFDHAYHALKDAILKGRLVAGTRLAEEPTAQRLGVSRTPIRQALQRLETERLVRRGVRGGAVVAELTPREIEDVYAVRAVLEGLAARLAAGSMSLQDHVRLEYTQGLLEKATLERRFEDLATLNLRFHGVILGATQNSTLVGFMAQIHDSLRRPSAGTMAHKNRGTVAMAEHRALIEALRNGDASSAEDIARRHIGNALAVRLEIHLLEEIG